MDNNEYNPNNTNQGNVSGFDSVNEPEKEPKEQGYTVTPNGGFYTRQKSDIIQDSPIKDESPSNNSADIHDKQTDSYSNNDYNANQPKTDYRPTGNYGYAPPPPPPPSQSYNQKYNDFNRMYNVPKPKGQKKEKKKYSAAVIIVSVILAALIGAASSFAVNKHFVSNSGATTIIKSDEDKSNVNINIDEKADSIAEAVAKKVTKSVVGIRTTTSVMSFFGGSSEATGEGSGVIYSADGYVITNYHVVESAAQSSNAKIEVFINNDQSKSYPANVIGYNISSDLAVLKIKVKGLTPVDIGDSSKLKTGQYVVTIGNPGGLEFMGSVTYGIISGLNRTVSTSSTVSLIQTDAAINPGNSGGALLNAKGELIGINSSKIVAEEYEGMGFAIPVNTVVEKCDSIISRQNKPEPYAGITISERYTAEVLEYYGYPVGAVVLSVDDNSPAQKTGISKGDIITEFNKTKITEYTMFADLLAECSPGDSVPIKIYRSGRYYSSKIEISSNGAQ